MKDNFSTASDQYAKYRPVYPTALFDFLDTIKSGSENAWDCGTGNGQVAAQLATRFTNVFATDISQSQMDHAVKLENIHYSLQPAEKTNFPDRFFDMVIVAQAIHWFDFEQFYAEVTRTAKPGALLAVIGYGRLNITPELDNIISDFYHNVIGPYWDKERRYIDENYETIPFPFEELDCPDFKNEYDWTFEHLMGYFQTWSAVKHYREANGQDPLELIRQELKSCWGTAETRKVSFPLLARIGKIKAL